MTVIIPRDPGTMMADDARGVRLVAQSGKGQLRSVLFDLRWLITNPCAHAEIVSAVCGPVGKIAMPICGDPFGECGRVALSQLAL
jgi:hypothetical protein